MLISHELKKRFFTGIFGGAFLIIGITWGGYFGALFFTVLVSFMMLQELVRVVQIVNFSKLHVALYIAAGMQHLVSYGFLAPVSVHHMLCINFFLLFYAALADFPLHRAQEYFVKYLFSVFALVYCVQLPALWVDIYVYADHYADIMHKNISAGSLFLLFFLSIVFTSDIAAYFIGRCYGSYKLYSVISPHKTLQGAAGAIVASGLMAPSLSYLLGLGVGSEMAMVLGIILSLIAQLGDLCESMLKRVLQQKDFAATLPGHGGFLDRFDSVLASAPVFYLWLKLYLAP